MIRRKYWLPKGRKIVSQVIYKSCLPCRRFVAKPFDPPPFPPLPSERVELLRPFLSVGLDYCGPLRIFDPNQTERKRKPLTKKYWIVLWVCLSSRALSLDLVPDLTNQSFLLAFRRFVAKCGLPKKLFSDNAPTFTSFQKALEPQFGIKNIEWDFRAPLAAWKSGHYERLVALIKYHLRRSLSIGAIPKLFSLDHITTVIAEIETIINSRPIAYDSSNPADPRPLRPIDFLKPLDHEHSQLLEKPITTSLAHLPRMALPQFSGNCVEFPSFWSSFQAAVGDLPNISDSVKLSYLKSCLRSAPLAVIESFPLVDQSYPQAVDLLKQKYENPTEISRSLCQSLKQLPTVRKGEYFCRDLSSLVNEFESLICRFTQQGENTDNIHIQLEIESKLPTFVLEEIYRAKENNPAWTTELLKQKLKAILKRKEDISAMNNSSPPKPQVSPSHKLYSPRNDSPPGPRSSLTFNTQTVRRSNAVEPKLPCLFCNVFGHFSPSCQQYPDLFSRRNKLKELRRCFSCMKEGHTTSQCRMPMRCSSCGGPHPRALCSNLLPSNPTFTPRPPQRPPQTYRNTVNENPRQYQHPTRLPNFHQPKPTPDVHFSQSTPYTRINDPRPPPPPNLEPNQQTNSSTNPTGNYRPILLKCVRTTIFNPDFPSCQYEGIVLLDDASTNTYIHTTVANALNLNLSPSSINLGVFNNPSITALPTYTTTFGLKLVDGRSLIIKANTLNHLTQPTPYVPFSNELVYEKDLVRNYQNIVPSILLGSDFYYEIEPTPIYRLPSGYHLIQTLLGLIIAGKPFGCSNSLQITNFSSQTTVQ
uniref:Integrase catalytic domain-containing protein n=1 Tax=Meloidogyne incognita TaxID=6306 RepID=A0A914L0A1_MELIC